MSFCRSPPPFRMRFRSGCCCSSGVSFDGSDAPSGGGVSGMLLILSTVVALFLCCANGQDALELKYRLEEEQSNGTIVGDVVRDANLGKIYDRAALRQLRFRFLRHSSMFVIDNSKGVIYTNSRIDRETACPGAELCDIRLDVVIQPQSHFRIIRVTVTLLDVNDNQPRFDAVERTVDVPEMAVVGTVLFVPVAIDLDSPENSVQKYMLVSDSDRFELMEHERKTDGTFDTKLVLVRGLDREGVDSYYLKILAVDGGFPQNTGSVSVNVRVLDVNDNKPVFERSVYNVTVPEDAAPRTTVLRVRAVDDDIDFNGEVSYSFSLQTLATYGHLFGINNQTGDIYIKESLDHETSYSYRLTVVAQDRGFDSVPVSVTVNVFVLDVNDNAPEVTIDTLSTVPGVAEISENSGPGTFVARVTITDRDSGDMGRFSCKLNDSHFEMTPTFDAEYQLVTAMSTVDRETRSEYYLTLTCTDFGNEPQVSVGELKVVVTDINDNDPVFSQTVYRGDLIENNYIGAVLFQVNATDRDAGNNSKIVYRIDGEAANWFHVEQETGLIKASISFDREESEQLRFHIIAEDQGVPSRSSSALAHVTILDVNDERPTFSHPGYSFAVQENQPIGAEVGAVAAGDRDSSIYGDITFSIVPIHGSDTFDINYKTGMITTLKELDRETHASYTLVVMASDRGVPPLSSTASVTVYVSDENDNPPTFDYPTHSNNTIYISNRTPKGHVVTRVRAHDLDVGRNAKIVYEISEETKTEMFDLDMELGTVLVRGELEEMDGRQYLLEFIARDDGEQQKVAFARLNIVVNKSVAFFLERENGGGGGALSSHNFMIVVLLAIVSIIIIIVLIVAIVIICKQGRNKQTHKYNCRTETLKMLSKGVKPSQSDGSNFNAIAQHGSASDDRVRREFVLGRDEQTLEMDDRSLPRYCSSSGDHQVATNCCRQPLHHYPSMSLASSNGTTSFGAGGSGPPIESSLASYSSDKQLSRANGCHGSKPTISQHHQLQQQQQQQPHPCKESEVDRLLKVLQRDPDADSVQSGDSGHGPSEEGEAMRAIGQPPPFHGHIDTQQVERLPIFWGVGVGVNQSKPDVVSQASLDHRSTPFLSASAGQGHSSSSSSNRHPTPGVHLSTFSPVLPHRPLRTSSLLGPSTSCSAIPSAYHHATDTSRFHSPKHRTLDGHAPLRLTGHLTNVSTNQRLRNVDCIHDNASVAMDTDACLQCQLNHHGPNSLDRNHRNGRILTCSGISTSCCGIPASCSGVPTSCSGVASAHLDPRMPLISETSERSTGRQDDDVTTTSGSYVIDADDLCNEIDELFFKDVRSVAS